MRRRTDQLILLSILLFIGICIAGGWAIQSSGQYKETKAKLVKEEAITASQKPHLQRLAICEDEREHGLGLDRDYPESKSYGEIIK